MQLTPVETIHEQLQSRLQCLRTAGKAARAASQTSQIMAQLGIVSFYREGIGFALGDCIHAPVVPQVFIGIEGITVIALGFWSVIDHLLNDFLGSVPDYSELQVAASEPVYDGDDEDFFFFSPMKVNNSSISASLT